MVTAYGRNDAVPNDAPALRRARSAARARRRRPQACRRADLLLVVGSRLGSSRASSTRATSSRARRSSRWTSTAGTSAAYYPVAVGIQADARETLAALLDALAQDARPAAPPRPGSARRGSSGHGVRRGSPPRRRLDVMPIKPQRVYAELRRALPPDTIVTLDAGAAPAYGYDRLHFARPRTFLTPLDLGGLGFAFPAALGAKLGRPDAPVLAIHGDGGFLMNAQELETAVRHGIDGRHARA